MDKIANRAIRRVLRILGKKVDNGASSDDLSFVLRRYRTPHTDLSKPIWERHGFNSQEELLQSWRANKARALKYFPERTPSRPGIVQSISDFIYRVRHGRRRPRPLTEFTSPSKYMRHAYREYPTYRRYSYELDDYTPVINAYLGRVADNYKGGGAYGRFRDLMHRHDVLSAYSGRYIQSTVPRRSLAKYEYNPEGKNLRLLGKLEDRMLRTTGSSQMPDGFFEVFPFRGPGSGSGVPEFSMPVVTAFRAQGPFATTGHVWNGPLTRWYDEMVRKSINKLNERGIPITHRNIKNYLSEALVDNTQTTLHSGRTYPDKMAKNYAHVFDADAKPTKDYESVFTAGDPNAPIPEQTYIVEMPDSTLRARQVEVINRAGMEHILKRQTVPILDVQGTSDLRLFKGTPFPVHPVIHPSGNPRIDNIVESVSQNADLGELRKGVSILYNPNARNPLNNTIGTKGAKYDDFTDFWYSPRVGSATGYALNPHRLTVSPEAAEGIRLIPVTSSELDALRDVYDVKDILTKLPSSVLADLTHLAASHGGNRASIRLAKHMNHNVSQLRAAIKDLAEGKGINNGLGKALTRNPEFRAAGIDVDIANAPDENMFKEVLGYKW